jgi:hypothetical protein
MSRDPEAGVLTDPASLHKYLYANGDPVNGWDPMGREDMTEVQKLLVRAAAVVGVLTACGVAIGDLLDTDKIALSSGVHPTGGKVLELTAEVVACAFALETWPFAFF